MVAIKSYQADAFLKAVERVPSAVLFYGTDAGLVGERAATLARRLAEAHEGEVLRLDDTDLDEDPDRIGVTLNVFMDVWTDAEGELHIDPPPTRPGDRFTIEAAVPLVAGVTACSAEKSNNGHCTPVDWRVERAGG